MHYIYFYFWYHPQKYSSKQSYIYIKLENLSIGDDFIGYGQILLTLVLNVYLNKIHLSPYRYV